MSNVFHFWPMIEESYAIWLELGCHTWLHSPSVIPSAVDRNRYGNFDNKLEVRAETMCLIYKLYLEKCRGMY